MDGIINVNKPLGITSNGVISRVKRCLSEKKIGHIGTLDPMATGVLPLFLGKMTKLISNFNQGDKSYRVHAVFGKRSDTLDLEGTLEPVEIPDTCTDEKVVEILKEFVGEINQIPPMFSAVKVNGKRLYELARKGQEVEREARRITIYSIDHVQCNMPELSFEVSCSKGTYIRSLVSDIAEKLGTAAYLNRLQRIRCGDHFSLSDAVDLDQMEKLDKSDWINHFVDPIKILPDYHRIFLADSIRIDYLKNGRSVEVGHQELEFSDKREERSDALVIKEKDRLLAIGSLEFSQDHRFLFKPRKVLI